MSQTQITGTQIATGTVPISDLKTTGTPSSTTYLRGDGSWSTPSGGTGTLQWINYATGFSTNPTVNSTISSGTVYNYIYNLAAGGTVTYYRLVPSSSSYQDAFYTTFSGGALSGLLAAKPLAF